LTDLLQKEDVLQPSTSPVDAGGGTTGRRADFPIAAVASWGIAALGIALRFRQFAFDRSLWNDEADLALNIINRGYIGLTRQLSLDQGAPIGFLWLEKTATEVFGPNEYALRLVPLLAGIASVLLFRSFTSRVLPPLAGAVALGLFAVSPTLVYFSSETKQYGVDVAAVVALAWILPRMLEGDLTWRKCLSFGGVGAVLVWCSFPAVFVLAAESCVIVIMRWNRKELGGLPRFLTGCGLWLASFGIEYIVSLRALRSNPTLLSFWAGSYPPKLFGAGVSLSATLSWFPHQLRAWIQYPWNLSLPAGHGYTFLYPLALILLIVGLGLLLWHRPAIGLFVLLVGVMASIAGMLHVYPLSDRLLVFTLPFVCLTLAAILLVSRHLLVQLLCIAMILIVTAPEIATAADAVIHPYTRVEERAALTYVRQHKQTGDAVLVEGLGEAQFVYYHETSGVNAAGIFGLYGSSVPCNNAANLARLQRWNRVWFVFGIDPNSEANAIAQYKKVFSRVGQVITVFYPQVHVPDQSDGEGIAAAMLLRIRHQSLPAHPAISAPSWQPAAHGCISVFLAPPSQWLEGINHG
jgi:hypothetical protein